MPSGILYVRGDFEESFTVAADPDGVVLQATNTGFTGHRGKVTKSNQWTTLTSTLGVLEATSFLFEVQISSIQPATYFKLSMLVRDVILEYHNGAWAYKYWDAATSRMVQLAPSQFKIGDEFVTIRIDVTWQSSFLIHENGVYLGTWNAEVPKDKGIRLAFTVDSPESVVDLEVKNMRVLYTSMI